uniref:MARVEL domain-containing protein n=1 Tax=Bursaphelenchus xylophilus TaxID=6326 RepID=A0A1I7RZX8_BURXY
MSYVRVFCCTCHVDGVVKAIAIVTFVLSFLGILGYFTGVGASAIVSVVITAVCAGCLLYGVTKEQPGFYWPYMIWNFLRIIGTIVAIVILSLAIVGLSAYDIEIKDSDGKIMTREARDEAKVLCIIGIVIYTLDITLAIWFQYIVVKGHRSMKSRKGIN